MGKIRLQLTWFCIALTVSPWRDAPVCHFHAVQPRLHISLYSVPVWPSQHAGCNGTEKLAGTRVKESLILYHPLYIDWAQMPNQFPNRCFYKKCKRRILLEVHCPEAWLCFHFSLSELVFVLLTKAVARGKEVPAPLLVHLPHIRFLKQQKTGTFSETTAS